MMFFVPCSIFADSGVITLATDLLSKLMKKTLFTCCILTALIVFSIKSYAQQKNTIGIVYGTGSDLLVGGGIGSAGYSSRGFTLVGVDYVHHFNQLFAIETGLEYSNNNLLWDYEDAYDPTFRPQKTRNQLLSVPVYANLTFLKYLFVNGGVSIDIEMDHPAQRIAPEQNGIGLFLGAGGKYTFSHITLFANPYFQLHHVISFDHNGDRLLNNTGFKFGLGYSF